MRFTPVEVGCIVSVENTIIRAVFTPECNGFPTEVGYVIAKVVEENGFFPVGLTVRGHEFHHSTLFHLNGSKFAYQIIRGHGITGREDGILYKNLFASYLHLHALGTPEWARGFVALACKERDRIGY